MPLYRVSVGYGIAREACNRILSDGIPSGIYAIPVRVINFYKEGSDDTVFEIEADTETIANDWHNALKFALGIVSAYNPIPPENPDSPPAALDVWSKVGQWTKTAGSSTTVISGLPSQPRGIIVWGSGLPSSVMGTYDENGGVVIGISNGTVNRELVYACQDNVNPTNCNRSIDTCAFHLIDPSGSATTHFTFSEKCSTITFASTSFTMNWSGTTQATTGFYFVFGGNDIVEVEIKDYEVGTTTTGEKSYFGLAQQNDFMFALMPAMNIAGGTWSAGTGAQGAISSVSIHAGSGNTKSWCSNIMASDNITSGPIVGRLQRVDKLFHTMIAGTSGPTSRVQQQAADWAGWLSGGFKLNWIDAPGATTFVFTGMFVKGGHWDAGAFNQPVANGQLTALITPSTSNVKGIFAFSIGTTDLSTSTTGNASNKWSIGAEDSSGNRGCLAYSGAPSAFPSQEATIMRNDLFMKHITSQATASSSLSGGEAVISNMATEGQFTVNYTETEGNVRQVVWFALLD